MGPRLRKMHTYHPRRRRKKLDLPRQALHDLKHKLSTAVGNFIVLIKQGNTQQITEAQQKAKSDFMKYSDEMRKLAQQLGNKYLTAVNEYLESVDTLIHVGTQWVDEEKIRNCYLTSDKLDRELAAA
jgi:predicted AlkP superfamily phosphohydrolase/phosphomutase